MNTRRKSTLLALATGVAAAAIAIPLVSAEADDPGPADTTACELTKLAIPNGYKHAWAHEVSDSGEYVAGGVPGYDGENPALWHDGKAIVPKKLRTETTGASGVNDSGQMVGSHAVGEYSVPWLYQDGKVTDFKVPKGHSGFARDINNDGHVVGYIQKHDDDSPELPALWTSPDAEPVVLDTGADTAFGTAYAINADGTIVGKVLNPQDESIRLWKWNRDGQGEELKRPAPGDLVDQGVKASIGGDKVVSVNSGNAQGDYPAYVWDLAQGTEGTRVDELLYVQNVSADGTIVGSSKDEKPAMLVDGTVTELPGAEGSGTPDENTAHDITPRGDVVVGVVIDKKSTTNAALWTCG